MEIGAQLYTVRAFTQTLADFSLTLRKVADMGYRTVQVSATCPYPAEWLREELGKNGLRCVLTHTPADRLTGDTERVIGEHTVFGCDHIGLGWWSFRPEEGMGYDDFLGRFAPAAEKIAGAGKLLMYHNHDQEFRKLDGKLILERLAEDMPADRMGFTLDTYWVQVGGGDPAWWVEHLGGRVPCLHLKDCAYGRKMAVLGEGNMNLDRVLEKAETAGTRWLLVEQDDCGGEDPFDCLRRSQAWLGSRGLM